MEFKDPFPCPVAAFAKKKSCIKSRCAWYIYDPQSKENVCMVWTLVAVVQSQDNDLRELKALTAGLLSIKSTLEATAADLEAIRADMKAKLVEVAADG